MFVYGYQTLRNITKKFITTSLFRYIGTTEAILLEENDV
ncbi:MAG: hypothetical protein H6P94_823 [Thermoplasmatales archaeon]|jgi:hypothetical protein|nr:hypothetical protein [Thermoplasmatales archaeon]